MHEFWINWSMSDSTSARIVASLAANPSARSTTSSSIEHGSASSAHTNDPMASRVNTASLRGCSSTVSSTSWRCRTSGWRCSLALVSTMRS